MAGLCEGGNEPPSSLKAISNTWLTSFSLLWAIFRTGWCWSCRLLFVFPCETSGRVSNLMTEGRSWLFNDVISTTRLFSVGEIGDSEMMPKIRHRLPCIHITVGKNLGENPTRYCPFAYVPSRFPHLLLLAPLQ
ncbi:hypothetical protein ANN_22314 [Periplaneta americana]|uniref:Per a allergen n=1 Tax=Periplaneta americana TaxID=6978 RepID=A0ABQ8S7T7_PERAM|nr:hypothetical protein ANN_22314 [Periplaneta americana]